jgi:hypothetical protein
MPASFRLAAKMFLEKPARREDGTARTSITTSTPASFSLRITSA